MSTRQHPIYHVAVLALVILAPDAGRGAPAVAGTRSGAPGTIATIAGRDTFYGDRSPATDAGLDGPRAVAIDSRGNLFIADTGNRRVRRVGVSGVITTVAGQGASGQVINGEQATKEPIGYPFSLAVDANDDLFIGADCRILKLRPDGTITIIAGNDQCASSGDGGPADQAGLTTVYALAVDTAGGVYLTDAGRVRKIDASGTIRTIAGCDFCSIGDGGPALSAALTYPRGLAVDASGNLLIAETVGGRVRRIDANGTITTVAGGGICGKVPDPAPALQADLCGVGGVAPGAHGDLYMITNRVRRLDQRGVVTTVAGGGPSGFSGDGGAAINAEITWPSSMAADSSGNLFFTDYYNSRVRKIDTNGIITTVAGNGTFFTGDNVPATNAAIASGGIAVDACGNVFYTGAGRVRRIDTQRIVTTIAGGAESVESGDDGPAAQARFGSPGDLAVGRQGEVFVVDLSGGVIRRIDPDGIIRRAAGNTSGHTVSDGVPATDSELISIRGIALDHSGQLFMVDIYWPQVRKVGTDGIITRVAGTGHYGTSGDGGPATMAQLHAPYAVGVDMADNVFVGDFFDPRVRKVGADGIISTVTGDGTFGFSGDGGPAVKARITTSLGIAPDGAGNVFFSDSNNQRVRKIDAAGVITTVVGNGQRGFAGDGGPAIDAELVAPTQLAIDASGNLLINDLGNSRIRIVYGIGAPLDLGRLLRITRIGGEELPPYPAGTATAPDVLLPTNTDVAAGEVGWLCLNECI